MSGWMKYPYLKCMDCPNNTDLDLLHVGSENSDEEYEDALDELFTMLVNHPNESCAWINGCTDERTD